MAHESFEDEAVAAVMNDLFVNIKVDREERPDIDAIYMSALHLLGEQGGWPLTMFLTPDGEPFWGGTYFPKTPGYGRPGFPQVLREVARIYHEEFDKVAKNRDALKQALADQAAAAAPGRPAPGILDEVADRLVRHIDPEHGGVGTAPKFPSRSCSSFCGAPGCARATRGTGARSPSPSRAWSRAASTTISAAGLRAMRWTSAGSCRTSRRCSTTMPA